MIYIGLDQICSMVSYIKRKGKIHRLAVSLPYGLHHIVGVPTGGQLERWFCQKYNIGTHKLCSKYNALTCIVLNKLIVGGGS